MKYFRVDCVCLCLCACVCVYRGVCVIFNSFFRRTCVFSILRCCTQIKVQASRNSISYLVIVFFFLVNIGPEFSAKVPYIFFYFLVLSVCFELRKAHVLLFVSIAWLTSSSSSSSRTNVISKCAKAVGSPKAKLVQFVENQANVCLSACVRRK